MEIPSYLWIDSVDFQITDEVQQGTASQKITDVWVTANGKNLGMYQIPARIPVLEHGVTRLSIDAGVMYGGIPQIRVKYPFFTSHTLTADLQKGRIDTLTPSFKYTDFTKFIIEDFESAGILYQAHGTSAPLRKTNDKDLVFHHPKEDNHYSALIELPYNDTIHHFEIRTVNPINLTYLNSNYCLMEINFCITHNVEIGMIAHSALSTVPAQQIPLANLSGNKNPEWKKVYVNFTKEIGEASSYQMKNFDVYIRATIPFSEKDARFLFDNIKIVYLPTN